MNRLRVQARSECRHGRSCATQFLRRWIFAIWIDSGISTRARLRIRPSMKKTSTPRGADATSAPWSFHIVGQARRPHHNPKQRQPALWCRLLSLLLEFSTFVPLFQGGRRVFCGRGYSLVRTTPPAVPLPRGTEPGFRPERCRLLACKGAAGVAFPGDFQEVLKWLQLNLILNRLLSPRSG